MLLEDPLPDGGWSCKIKNVLSNSRKFWYRGKESVSAVIIVYPILAII